MKSAIYTETYTHTDTQKNIGRKFTEMFTKTIMFTY